MLFDFQPRLPGMIDLLKRLIEAESPSRDKEAVDRAGAIVSDEVRRLGADVEIVPNLEGGNQIVARWVSHLHPPSDGTNRTKEGILLLCHMDTVFPLGTIAKMPFQQGDGRIYGPGALDMKGGIVIAIAAIAGLKEAGAMPPHPISVLFTSDEEIGSPASRPLIERLAGESALVLVLESGLPDGALKTWRKGVGNFTIKTQGRAAHAGGAHENGRNAIEELAHQVVAIQKMTDYEKGTTLNVGLIKGGIASNVVPDEAAAEVDFRVLVPEEADRVSAAMRSLEPVIEGTSIAVSGGLNRPPMPFDETMRATFEKAKKIAAGIGLELGAGGSGGGSDGNFVAPLGIPLLDGLGGLGEGLHSEREYISIPSLPERARLLAALLSQW
jgi:glutamate carboxypeptidase